MTKTVLALCSIYPVEMDDLEEHFRVIRLWRENDPESVIKKYSNDIVAVITAPSRPVRRSLIEALPNLEIIASFSVGTDHIPLAAAAERGIAVTNTPDVVTADTADIAMALILGVARRTMEADVYVRVGKWVNKKIGLGVSLTGKTLGLLGMGHIGQAVARRVRACDMHVVYHCRNEVRDQPYRYYPDLVEMARESDFLVVACTGGAETKHLVDYRVLEALGPKGFLVNVARGSVVDQEALLVALRNQSIAGAGLDVYENEPQVPEVLFSMDNVVLLPHIGTATYETWGAMGHLVVDNLLAYFDGKPLKTPVVI